MAVKRDRPHIQVPAEPWRIREGYTPHKSGGRGDKPIAPPKGRPTHGVSLKRAIETAQATAFQRRDAAVEITGATPGIYLEFESFPGWDLASQSMEKRRAKDPR